MNKIYFLSFFLLLLSSCSMKRNVVADSSHISNDTTSTVHNDSLSLKTDGKKETTEKEIKKENTVEVITEYDTLGNISRTVETYNFIESVTKKAELDIVKKDWLYGSSTIQTSDSKSETINHKTETINKDSRPIQGTEWVWFILSTVLAIIFMILYFNFKK